MGGMSTPTITALYAALNAVLNVYLASRVSAGRRKGKVSVGIGDSKDLEIAVRIHGNNAEFVPLALLMMLIAELCGGGSTPLHLYGGLLFAARLAHPLGMGRPAPNAYRMFGVATTWVAILVASGWVLWLRRAH